MEIISEALDFNVEDWFAKRGTEEKENEWFDYETLLGDWKEINSLESTLYVLEKGISRTSKDTVYIGLAEIQEAWMLPAFVNFGGWNECPEPHIHCSVMKYWNEKFGAEIVTMTDDYIECFVPKPPQTKEEAIQLAWQQYWYSSDIVDQGTQTVSTLGATLLNAKYWFFWWD